MQRIVVHDPKHLAAERWFGYGSWSAPYWFIGKEPGGADDRENYSSWIRLGARDLVDCRDHDLEYLGADRGKWHLGERPPLQPTWRPLIALLLGFSSDAPYDKEAVRKYQAEKWGRLNGDTAVLELSAVAAPSVSVHDDLRLHNVDDRIELLKARIARNNPTFIVMYGAGTDPVNSVQYIQYWSRIAGRTLAENEPARVGATTFVAVPHPTAHGLTTKFWTSLGHRLRDRSRSTG
jgi:hypothetical protein